MIFESVRLSLVLSMSRQAAATVMAELRQKPALLRVLRNWNSSGEASSDAGPELAGRESRVAMESPQALMCPLKMGLAGLTSRHQTTGRVRVFATANTWRTQRPRGASGFGTESQ